MCSKGGLLAVVCHGALVLARAVRSKSPRGSRRVRSMGRITIRNHWKCSHAICTVASATCNSHVLLHRQRLIVEVVHGVAAETVSRRRRHRTWQGAADAEGGKAGRAGDAAVKSVARVSSGLTRSAAARRLHGHDDDAFISPTTSIPGRASVRDRIDRAKGITVRQAIRLKFYTTRSLKRDETAGYIHLVRATGEGETDTVMRDAEVAELESDRSPMISDTDVNIPVDDFSD